MKTPNIAILLLAAGASSRMGTPKQLLPWKGTVLLDHVLQMAEASAASEVIVILGSESENIKTALNGKVQVLENKDWQNGLGSSIACGLDYLIKNKKSVNGVLLMLGDQPLMDTTYLDNLIASFTKGKKGIVASSYGSHAGVPALFGKQYFEALQNLESDAGARELLMKYSKDIQRLHAGKRVLDVDAPEDYERLLASLDDQ